jgi:3-oxoacyl-[acyl-carrier protein] reductase
VDLRIKGRTALVTGASGGLGQQIAHSLAAEGTDVVLFSRSPDRLQAIAAEIEGRHDVRAVPVAGSMLNESDVRRLATMLEELNGPDIVVLVTGRPPTPLRETLDETEPGRWQEAYENQLASVVHVVNAMAPLMLGRGWGRIIAITSAHARQPAVGHALSTVFRAGATAYMKSLALDLAARNITVNCVAPALIDTTHRSGQAAYTAEQAERRKALAPMRRMGTQEEVCAAVAFLASEQAGFITGSTITIDGGLVGALF